MHDPLAWEGRVLQVLGALHDIAQFVAKLTTGNDLGDAGVLHFQLGPIAGSNMVGGARNDAAAVFLERMEHPRPAGDVPWQIGLAKVLIAAPGGRRELGVVELPLGIPVFVVVGERQVRAFGVGNPNTFCRTNAFPGPLVHGIDHLDGHGMCW